MDRYLYYDIPRVVLDRNNTTIVRDERGHDLLIDDREVTTSALVSVPPYFVTVDVPIAEFFMLYALRE